MSRDGPLMVLTGTKGLNSTGFDLECAQADPSRSSMAVVPPFFAGLTLPSCLSRVGDEVESRKSLDGLNEELLGVSDPDHVKDVL